MMSVVPPPNIQSSIYKWPRFKRKEGVVFQKSLWNWLQVRIKRNSKFRWKRFRRNEKSAFQQRAESPGVDVTKLFFLCHRRTEQISQSVCSRQAFKACGLYCKHIIIVHWWWCKVGGVKVYPRQTWNFRSHAVSVCSKPCYPPMTSQADACHMCMQQPCYSHHGVTGWCMQLLNGLCCFDFILDIPFLQLLCKWCRL